MFVSYLFLENDIFTNAKFFIFCNNLLKYRKKNIQYSNKNLSTNQYLRPVIYILFRRLAIFVFKAFGEIT